VPGLDTLVLNELEEAVGSYFLIKISGFFLIIFGSVVIRLKRKALGLTSVDVISSNDFLACLQQAEDHVEGSHATADGVGELGIANFGQMFLCKKKKKKKKRKVENK